jgi:hypothetical protein
MRPHSPRIAIALATAIFAAAIPADVNAECIEVRSAKKARRADILDTATLAFTGTVVTLDIERYTVSFIVDRVWKGQVRREATLLAPPGIEEVGMTALHVGGSYVVLSYIPTTLLTPEAAEGSHLPAGTLSVSFGCSGPVPVNSTAFKILGRGKPPLP